jgi:hypothetical protein
MGRLEDRAAKTEQHVPLRVDETIRVACPLWCRHCLGGVKLQETGHQYLVDLPEMRPRVTQFVVD